MYHVKKSMLKSITILLVSLITMVVHGQNIQVLMEAPGSVTIDEQFQLNITVNADPGGFAPPSLSDFNILTGPNASSSSSVQIVNNKMSQSFETTYSYILQPKKNGKFTISPASFVVNGKKYASNALNIEVSGTRSASQGNGNTSSGTGNEKVDANGNLFLKIFLDKKSASVGEYITGSVKLYSKYQITNVAPAPILPDFNGFYKQDIPIPPLHSLNKENVNGKTFLTATIAKFVLIPQKAGKLNIGNATFVVVVQIPSKGGGGFFDDFFQQMSSEQVQVKSTPFSVDITPLPNKPSSFTGAVGKFSFSANYDKNKVNANDPVMLKLSIQGTGNLKLIDPPKIDFPDGIETSEPSVTNKVNDKDGGISGSKEFDYLLIPRAPGKMTMPPVEFSYYDPAAHQFKTINTAAFTLDVMPGSSNGIISQGQNAREDVQFLGKDIEYIKLNDIPLEKKGNSFFGSLWFYLSYALLLFSFAGILAARRNYIRQNSNMALVKNKKAQKYAISRLKKAKEYLNHSKKENFYEEVLKALWGYLSDKLNIPVSDLSRDYAKVQLFQAGVDETSVERVMNLIDICEYARYAPATGENSMEADYKEAISIISHIQEKIR